MNNVFVSVPGPGCVQVHPLNLYIWEQYGYLIFYLFRSKATGNNFITATGRTDMRNFLMIAAIVTNKMIVFFMIRQADITIFTFRDPATQFTFQEGSESSPVLKQNDLFIQIESGLHSLHKSWCKMRIHLLLSS